MELAEGGDLLDHVNEHKYKSEEEIKKHFLQLALAMCYTHQMGVVHRDLKLENLVLDKDGNLKITGNKLILYCRVQHFGHNLQN